MENRIKQLREEKGWTQADLADETGLSVRTIQRIESGKVEIKGHSLKQLQEVFGISLSMEETIPNEVILMNLSILIFLIIPFGNLIFPVRIWYKKRRQNQLIDQLGRKIINFQILWFLTSCLGALIFILITHFSGIHLIFWGMISLVFINVFFVLINANKLQKGKTSIYEIPLKFL